MNVNPLLFAGMNSIDALERIVITGLGLLENAGYTTNPDTLRLKTRHRAVSLTRYVCMYYINLYKLLPTYTSIGHHYGGFTHPTVVYARRVVKNAMAGYDMNLPQKKIETIQTTLENLGYGYKKSA